MIYDAFMFFNELDLLEIRLHELDAVVDQFILVESPWTHSGWPKPLHFEENKERFSRFSDRITHIVVRDMPTDVSPREREAHQREAVLRGLTSADPRDTVILSDVDEIPRASVLHNISAPATLVMDGSAIYVNCHTLTEGEYHNRWDHAVVLTVQMLRERGAELSRMDAHNYPRVEKAGWHFSYCGGRDSLKEKFDAFSHQEPQVQEFNNPETIDSLVRMDRSLYDNGHPRVTPLDETFPQHLLNNTVKFSKLIAP